jgi:hypothetical protein
LQPKIALDDFNRGQETENCDIPLGRAAAVPAAGKPLASSPAPTVAPPAATFFRNRRRSARLLILGAVFFIAALPFHCVCADAVDAERVHAAVAIGVWAYIDITE